MQRGRIRRLLVYVVPFVVLMLTLTLVCCSAARDFRKGFEKGFSGEVGEVEEVIEEPVEEATEEVIVGEPEEKPAAETATDETAEEEPGVEESTETIEENEKENINKFFEQIREYDILTKNVDYCTMAYEAVSDWVDGKISREDVGSRYMEITRKVRDNYFLFDILFTIGESSLEKEGITVTDDMERVIELISNWSNKKVRYYEYMANYYHGDGPEYEIEANKIEDELDEITDEYIELTNEMTKKAKTE